jgi:ribosome-binding factor A
VYRQQSSLSPRWQTALTRLSSAEFAKLVAIYFGHQIMARNSFNRTDRVAALLRREVATLVHQDVRDGVVPEMSVSDVEVSRDLAHATVFVTALKSEQSKEGVKLLNEQSKGYRQFLSKTLSMRQMPALHFKYDDSVDRGMRIEELLRGAGDSTSA